MKKKRERKIEMLINFLVFLPIKRSQFWGSETCLQTEAIIENYDKLNETILRIYESESFLETILEMLTS